jgi:CRP-like cAMP-binding protein
MISRELLRQQSLFQDLPEKALTALQPQVRLQEFQKRDFVLHKGGAGDALVLLLTGRLQVFSVSESGKEVGISFIEPGDHFGEISLIDGGPRSASVMAVINSTVGFVPKATAALCGNTQRDSAPGRACRPQGLCPRLFGARQRSQA